MLKNIKDLAKNKLRKFAQMQGYNNVEQPSLDELRNGYYLKGKWKNDFFKNDNPIVLELGCGKGEYSVSLAERYPQKNFIGIDIKGARMWQGATDALSKGFNNVGFLRVRIEWIEMCFSKNEIDEIWITFPDPQLKKRRRTKRLTHPFFIDKYKKIIKENTTIHLKTDSQFLYGFTLGVIESLGYDLEDCTNNLYNDRARKHMDIKTHYEQIYLKKGIPITYLRFKI